MSRKRMLVLIIGTLLVSIFLIYWFYFAKPSSFLNDEDIMEDIHSMWSGITVTTIQDKVFLDDAHVFVPHITELGSYGASYWIWEKHRWKLIVIETSTEPIIWRLDPKDPSTHHVVWNFHPEDNLSTASFYLVNKRGYHGSNGVETYIPRVQMEYSMPMDSKTYGTLKLPDDWTAFMDDYIDVELTNVDRSFFNSFIPAQQVYIGWIPYDKRGKVHIPKNSINGSSYNDYHEEVFDFVMIMNEAELE